MKQYIVCDTYKEESIKSGERKLRGSSQQYMLKSPDMKLPADMTSFCKNGSNKETLFNLIETAYIQEKQKLENRIIYFSNANHCTKITQTEVTIESDKSSDHIEADTK